MNPDTRVAVCCYQGDQHMVEEAMEFHKHHECPVTVLSPIDSPVVIEGVDCAQGGGVGYIHQVSLDRQAEHLRLLLTYPENHFLINDSDSVVLTPELPAYLYEQPDTVWSNQVFDDIPEHQATFPEGWPHVAFQPPYFLSRKSIEAMLAVKDDPRVKATPVMPFIDYYMVQLTMVAGLPWAKFPDSISCPISVDLRKLHVSARDKETYGFGMQIAREAVSRGAVILHSIKNERAIRELIECRKDYLAGNPNPAPRVIPAKHVGGNNRHRFSGPHQQSGLKA